jgi:uncharacterized protein YlaN (UPF0358 family)
MQLDELRVAPGASARLSTRDPAERLGLSEKDEGRDELDKLRKRLDGLHNRLWSEAQR